jgi:hypothetical protein
MKMHLMRITVPFLAILVSCVQAGKKEIKSTDLTIFILNIDYKNGHYENKN